jgi:hypothetical protein
MTWKNTLLLAPLLVLMGCSGDYKMATYEREKNFFALFENAGQEESQAAKNLENIKLLHTDEQFPIRLALYDNGRFYYQVDELGNGYGDWTYENGGLKLTTRRKIFDMNFYVVAKAQQGTDLVIKFFDRHGFNQYDLTFRDPRSADPTAPKPEKLREFKSSPKDI